MNAETTEIPKTKPRLNIPTGALIIIPMRNRVLYPSMVMPLMTSVCAYLDKRLGATGRKPSAA